MSARARGALGSWDAVILLALIVVAVVGALTIDGVASPRFWRFVTLEAIPIALIALPMTLIVITGEIDLSVASVLGLTCTVVGQLWVTGVTSLPVLIAVALLLGAVLGAVNGLFITGFGLPSLAVTIGTLALYRGLAYVVLGDRAVANYPVDLDHVGDQAAARYHHPVGDPRRRGAGRSCSPSSCTRRRSAAACMPWATTPKRPASPVSTCG